MITAKSILNKFLDLILKPSRLKIMLDNLLASDLVLGKVTQKLEKVCQEEVSVIHIYITSTKMSIDSTKRGTFREGETKSMT